MCREWKDMKNKNPSVLFSSKSEDPEISILIPVHNGGPFLTETIQSIRRQRGVRFELVIVDDASTDDSLERLHALRQDDMTLLALASNQGCGAARNQALPFARAPWICPFDADDIMLPDRLAPYFRFAQSQPNTLWGCCGVLLADADGRPRQHAMGQPFDTVGMLEANAVNHGMTLIRRDALERTGGYETTLARGIDYSMMLKLTLQGRPVFYNEICYLYRMSPSSITHTREYPLAHIHSLFRQWLEVQIRVDRETSRAGELLRILDMHQAIRRADWPDVNALCEKIRLTEPDSFECEKYRILSLVMIRRFEEASVALLAWLAANPLDGLTGLVLRRRQAAQRWMLDQALRLVVGAGRTELLPTCLPLAENLHEREPTPVMEKLITACRRNT